MENIKINKLEIENVKRVKAVKVEPSQNGLTVIGGRNKQGKTSVLDAIAWTLGGDRYKPSKACPQYPKIHAAKRQGKSKYTTTNHWSRRSVACIGIKGNRNI